jgi:hypothetical protein
MVFPARKCRNQKLRPSNDDLWKSTDPYDLQALNAVLFCQFEMVRSFRACNSKKWAQSILRRVHRMESRYSLNWEDEIMSLLVAGTCRGPFARS